MFLNVTRAAVNHPTHAVCWINFLYAQNKWVNFLVVPCRRCPPPPSLCFIPVTVLQDYMLLRNDVWHSLFDFTCIYKYCNKNGRELWSKHCEINSTRLYGKQCTDPQVWASSYLPNHYSIISKFHFVFFCFTMYRQFFGLNKPEDYRINVDLYTE